ncbi:hypothetical protein [Meiothermus sp. QL-1]|uniref:hypothetical protein n=1 Tax=Meiothermus sp. QL-1 TaxID=2058095 RepID=UPI001F3DB1FE|nr:hypothetical protein [Meiothermus sp. QL-1]
MEQVVSPLAARSLLRRALGPRGPERLGPEGWAKLIEGPLQQELANVLPGNALPPELRRLVRELRAGAVSRPAFPTLEATDLTEYVDLRSEEDCRALVQDLARGEGVLAVVLDSAYGQECRLGSFNTGLVAMLGTVHRLLARKGDYRVFYTVFREAQLVLRSLHHGYLAVLTRSEANLGQLLFRMDKIEALQAGVE